MMTIDDLHRIYLSSAGIATDTRQIAQGCIFFALRGDQHDGNIYANEALEKGAAYAVVDDISLGSDGNNAKFIQVDNVLTTLHQLSAYHRHLLKCPVLAITGSNGKTTTKELTAAVLSKKYKTVASRNSFNNEFGVPLTILSAPLDTEFLVLEMGANKPNEIADYCIYADPDHGLITNIGKAHLLGFGSIEGVLKAKLKLYEHIKRREGVLFVSSADALLISKAKEHAGKDHIIYYGQKEDDFCAGKLVSSEEYLAVKMYDGTIIQTQLIGQYNFDNVLTAACIGKYFGVTMADIKHALESYVPTNNRSQKINLGSNTIVMDAYNANPTSMAEALNSFEQINASNKVTVLGEMRELGDYSDAEHRKIIEIVDGMNLSMRIFSGAGFHMLKGRKDVLYFENTELLKAWYSMQHFENTTQLIKGSRGNKLESIFQK